jgi:hypothetical protein
MKEQSKIPYRNWYIVPFAVPQPDGKWAANCEIEKSDADGLDIFQEALPTFLENEKESAIIIACTDAKRRIDGIIADPLG